jgi:protease-4
VFVISLSGCAFFTVPLATPTLPLEEMVLEGDGPAKILLVNVSGTISEQARSRKMGLEEEASMVSVVKEELLKAQRDREIKGVIVKIDSPGGTVTASDLIYYEIMQYKKRTGVRVAACIMGQGTSGGYYVASAADDISALPTAITGSIGVIAMKFDVKNFLNRFGVYSETFKSGDKKDILTPFRPSTPEETEIIQGVIMQLYGRFVDVVSEGRKNVLTRDQVVKLADGRIYTADQALKNKLIDRVGYLSDAIDSMKGALKVDRARVVTYIRPGTYKGSFYSGMPESVSPVINLININADSLQLMPSVHFMYMWNP